ncbi:MAG TPA: hypothetical protein VKJ01_02520 [Candidatus Solibacter sp.]|nr:hypothetical protein [Candidatus Solibacter sp.]
MRITSALPLILCLAACNRGTPNNDAVRQGVMDHLSRAGLNMAGMDVAVKSVQVHGSQADAAVTITAKGGNAAQGMQMTYHMEQKDGKWVVVGRGDGGQHGSTMAPPVASPRVPGSMPSPEDLPPAAKKQ